MTAYLARRAVLALLTLIVITAALYAAVRCLPGAPSFGEEGASAPRAEWLARSHGLDPVPIGYARWLADIARLDFGTSIAVQPGRPVLELVAAALPYTFALGLLGFLLTIIVAVPLGVLSAWRPESAGARTGAGLLYVLHAVPAFWLALALQQSAGVRLGLLPSNGAGPVGDTVTRGGLAEAWVRAPYWVLPVAALTLGSLAFVIRFCRSAVCEAAAGPYVRAARARGAADPRVLFGHALSNAALSLITLLGLMLPGVVSGSVLIETIFALPGLGRLFFTAAGRRDYPVMMGLALLTASATLAAGFLADCLYRWADPRAAVDDMVEPFS